MNDSLVVGRVHVLDSHGNNLGMIKPAEQYFREMAEIARTYYSLRHLIPLGDAQLRTYDTINSEIAQHLSKKSGKASVLDIAGSNGSRLEQIQQKLLITLDRHLVDIDEASVIKARTSGINASCLDMTQERLPYADNSLDSAMICFALEHVDPKRYQHVLSEIHRVLKPQGHFYFADFLGFQPSSDPKEEKVIADLGYKQNRTFFLGIYNPKDRKSASNPNETPISNRTHTLLAGPVYTAGFGIEEITSFQDFGFKLEQITAVEWDNKSEAGKILSTKLEEMKSLEKRWPAFLAIYRKR